MTSDDQMWPPVLVGVKLDGERVLVVGGGPVATRRAARLAAAGALVTVVAPEAGDELAGLAAIWHRRRYETGDVEGVALVVTATGDPEVDGRVVDDARRAGILVNDATDAAAGTVIVPAEVRRGDVTVAITTGGSSPSLARWLASRIEVDLLGPAAEAATLMGALRDELRAAGRPTAHPGWAAALDAGLVEVIAGGDRAAAEAMLRAHLDLES